VTASGVSGTDCSGCTVELLSGDEEEGRICEGTAIADADRRVAGSPDLPTYVAAALIENLPLQRSGRSVSPDRHREDIMTKRLILLTVTTILLVTSVSPMPGGAAPANDLQPQAYLPLIVSSIPARDVEIIFEFSQVVRPEGDPRDLAVAFHAISYIDRDASPLGELVFGTPEANALQGDGWYENQDWPDVGSFQWAGGTDGCATMQLHVPAHTEGLLLHTRAITEDVWADVKVNGALAAELRVTDEWWHGYVPMVKPMPEPTPDAEPKWTEGRYFPAFPDSQGLYSMRIPAPFLGQRALSWRINQSYQCMMDLTLVGMQGVINRSGARVYFDWYEPAYEGQLLDTSGYWPLELAKHVDVIHLDLDALSAFSFLMRRYSPRFSGAVIYDPLVPDTINLATMLAGLEDRIMLAPEQLDLPGVQGWLEEMEERFEPSGNPQSLPTLPGFQCATDLQALAQDQGWQATEESQTQIYQWVYDNLWPDLEHRIIGLISPGPPTSREQFGEGIWWPLGFASRDYLVALRLAVLYLHPEEGPQATLFEQYLGDAPPLTPVTGVFSGWEEGTTALASRYGDWIAGISWPGAVLRVAGLSVHSGVRPDVIPYEATLDDDRILATLGDGPVATMFSTDGDAIFYQMGHGFSGEFGWKDVQGQRFGWSHNPVLSELAPVVWNDYVQNRSEVSLLAGTAGVGYMYPQHMDEQQMASYLEYAARYLDETGIRSLFVYSVDGTWPAELSQRYYDGLHDHRLLGLILGGNSLLDDNLIYHGDPVPAVWSSYSLRPGNVEAVADDLLSRTPGEVHIDLPDYPHHEGQAVEDPAAVGGWAARFSREHLPPCCMVVSGPNAMLLPGEYSVTFRLKLPDNTGTGNIARVAVHGTVSGGGALPELFLSPGDFDQPGEYQDFTMPFSLGAVAHNVEVWVDYYGGEPGHPDVDMCADTIDLSRLSGPALPIFAVATLMWEPDLEDVPTRFKDRLEAGGGVVLHPDEFLAALNPEFMIEWATPYLGADHPAIVDAETLLGRDRFLESLLAVREGLNELK
jgi:hypothetical protein